MLMVMMLLVAHDYYLINWCTHLVMVNTSLLFDFFGLALQSQPTNQTHVRCIYVIDDTYHDRKGLLSLKSTQPRFGCLLFTNFNY